MYRTVTNITNMVNYNASIDKWLCVDEITCPFPIFISATVEVLE